MNSQYSNDHNGDVCSQISDEVGHQSNCDNLSTVTTATALSTSPILASNDLSALKLAPLIIGDTTKMASCGKQAAAGKHLVDEEQAATAGFYSNTGSLLVQKTKLILPTAMWILLIVSSVCFLCLLSSLNKTLNSLDATIERDELKHALDTARHSHKEAAQLKADFSPFADSHQQKSRDFFADGNEPLVSVESFQVAPGIQMLSIENSDDNSHAHPHHAKAKHSHKDGGDSKVVKVEKFSTVSTLPLMAQTRQPLVGGPPSLLADTIMSSLLSFDKQPKFANAPNFGDDLDADIAGIERDDDDDNDSGKTAESKAPLINAKIGKLSVNINAPASAGKLAKEADKAPFSSDLLQEAMAAALAEDLADIQRQQYQRPRPSKKLEAAPASSLLPDVSDKLLDDLFDSLVGDKTEPWATKILSSGHSRPVPKFGAASKQADDPPMLIFGYNKKTTKPQKFAYSPIVEVSPSGGFGGSHSKQVKEPKLPSPYEFAAAKFGDEPSDFLADLSFVLPPLGGPTMTASKKQDDNKAKKASHGHDAKSDDFDSEPIESLMSVLKSMAPFEPMFDFDMREPSTRPTTTTRPTKAGIVNNTAKPIESNFGAIHEFFSPLSGVDLMLNSKKEPQAGLPLVSTLLETNDAKASSTKSTKPTLAPPANLPFFSTIVTVVDDDAAVAKNGDSKPRDRPPSSGTAAATNSTGASHNVAVITEFADSSDLTPMSAAAWRQISRRRGRAHQRKLETSAQTSGNDGGSSTSGRNSTTPTSSRPSNSTTSSTARPGNSTIPCNQPKPPDFNATGNGTVPIAFWAVRGRGGPTIGGRTQPAAFVIVNGTLPAGSGTQPPRSNSTSSSGGGASRGSSTSSGGGSTTSRPSSRNVAGVEYA